MNTTRIPEEDIIDENDDRILKAALLSVLTGGFGALFFLLCFFFTFGVNKSEVLANFWMHYAWVWIPMFGVTMFSILFWLAKRWSVI